MRTDTSKILGKNNAKHDLDEETGLRETSGSTVETRAEVLSIRYLTYWGQQIWIYRDLPPRVARRRAAFTPARKILRDKPGIEFGLPYPTKLRVTHDGFCVTSVR
ncbi:hypothetical protein GOODEAATRI_025549 [Goodea atripinnis]|uniref:Uncharacterized protein n=1 Tax=Goodea atripinnis TaxID=208336 RepID=A0ABV0NXN7_9TELE